MTGGSAKPSLAEHRVVGAATVTERTGAAGTGSDTLFFLHGLGGDWTNHLPQFAEFESTHRCISWTMPGYGASPSLPDVTWDALAAAAVAVLDSAEVERATLVGLSMGGYVAQQIAFDYPDRVDGLVLVGTSATFGRPGDESFKDKFLALRHAPLDEGKTPADLAPTVVDGLLGPAPHQDARANCIASMSNITSEAYRRALACLVTWDSRDRLAQVSVPTLCVAGADDATAPVASLERLAGYIAGASIEVIDRCGHLVNLERPAEFNALLKSFLANSSQANSTQSSL